MQDLWGGLCCLSESGEPPGHEMKLEEELGCEREEVRENSICLLVCLLPLCLRNRGRVESEGCRPCRWSRGLPFQWELL